MHVQEKLNEQRRRELTQCHALFDLLFFREIKRSWLRFDLFISLKKSKSL